MAECGLVVCLSHRGGAWQYLRLSNHPYSHSPTRHPSLPCTCRPHLLYPGPWKTSVSVARGRTLHNDTKLIGRWQGRWLEHGGQGVNTVITCPSPGCLTCQAANPADAQALIRCQPDITPSPQPNTGDVAIRGATSMP